jgi:hypothetical protein
MIYIVLLYQIIVRNVRTSLTHSAPATLQHLLLLLYSWHKALPWLTCLHVIHHFQCLYSHHVWKLNQTLHFGEHINCDLPYSEFIEL